MQDSTKEKATKNIPIGETVHAKLQAQAQKENRTIRFITERAILKDLSQAEEPAHAS